LYNTRAVVRLTGVPADTFRAWERRYGVPRPFRTSGNQRLYSELDVGVIGWLRDRTGEGMTISRAIRRLQLEVPAIFDASEPPEAEPARAIGADHEDERLRQRFHDAVAEFDTQRADGVLDDAMARYSVDAFCERFVEPVLVEIGERWSRNEASVAVEHFATGVLSRRLSALFTIVAPAGGRGRIVAACPAGEEHAVGLLVLAILLARRGWSVIYLGANVPAADLVDAVTSADPDLVCLSAASPVAITEAVAVVSRMRAEMAAPPPVALGGRAVTDGLGVLRDAGIAPISGSGLEAVERVAELLDEV
jgi:methanogenic corrinoid protein MtbC1